MEYLDILVFSRFILLIKALDQIAFQKKKALDQILQR